MVRVLVDPDITTMSIASDSNAVIVLPVDEVMEWVEENMSGRVYFEAETLLFTTGHEFLIAVFETEEDAALFKLRWE